MKGSRNLLISLLVVGAFAAAGFYLLGKNARLPEHPLDRAPGDAEIVAWVDVPSLLRSSLWRRFVVDAGEDAAIRRLSERCGFDPLGQVQNVTAFVTGEPGSLDHVGFVAEGDFDHEALGGCLRSAVGEDGGSLEEVEIEGARAVASAHGPSRAAFVGARGIVAGHEEIVASTLRSIAGRESALGSDAAMRPLWDRLARTREVVAIAKIPEHWQDGLRRLIGAERASILAPHFVHLRMVGLGARVSRGFGATVVAVTESDEAATELSAGIREGISRLNGNLLVAISPVGAVLSQLETEVSGMEVTVGLDITEERLDRIFGFADRMLERLAGPSTATPTPDATPAPDPSTPPAPSAAPTPASSATPATAPSATPTQTVQAPTPAR